MSRDRLVDGDELPRAGSGSGRDLPWAAEVRRVLGPRPWKYFVAAGADSANSGETTFGTWSLIPRVLTGLDRVDTSVELFGKYLAAPIVVGPFVADHLFAPQGLLELAEAASEAKLALIVSEEATTPLSEVVGAHPDPWLQIRAAGTTTRARQMVDVAAAHAIRVLVVTVLAPAHAAPGCEPGGVEIGSELLARGLRTVGSSAGVDQLDAFPRWTWDDLLDVVGYAAACGIQVVAKGVLDPCDARRAEEVGCAGVIVSNTGGSATPPARIADRPTTHGPGGVLLRLRGNDRRRSPPWG